MDRRNTPSIGRESWLMDVRDRKAARLADDVSPITCPAWSPDGSRLAIVHLDPSNGMSLRTLTRDGLLAAPFATSTELRGTALTMVTFAWLKDGHIVYSRWAGD